MKKLLILILGMLLLHPVCAQDNSAVYLFDLKMEDGFLNLSNPIDMSDAPGYHNQPSFLNDGSGVVFASTRNGQTDILLYEIEYELKTWITNTPGSEYSPMQLPDGSGFTAVRLDTDGTQLLRHYGMDGTKKKGKIKDLKIGYYTWYDMNTVVSFVLGDPQTLRITNLKKGTSQIVEAHIGRSIHKIPGSNLVSYIDNNKYIQKICSLNPKTGEKKELANALIDAQDMAWLPDGSAIMGKGDKLFTVKPGSGKSWDVAASLYRFGLENITRIAVSPNGDKIAIVVTKK